MVSTGVGLVRDDATCGPLFDECYADLNCRESIRDGIRAGFNVHAIRAERHRDARFSGGGAAGVRSIALAF